MYQGFYVPNSDSLQIIERILLCSKKTKFHDDVLRIFYLHLDPHLPLPRIRMLSVLLQHFMLYLVFSYFTNCLINFLFCRYFTMYLVLFQLIKH